MQVSSKIMIVAGGTGGHIFPALAVAEYLVEKGFRVYWLGTEHGMEQKLVSKRDYLLFTISIFGVRGKGIASWLLLPFHFLFALLQSLYILLKVRPNAVLGMGGFVSGPAGIAAVLLGIPLLIHEQNTVAGTTNRLLAPLAKVVMEAFPGTFTSSKKVLFSGNPVCKSILRAYDAGRHLRRADRSHLNLLVLGGSQGAERLNHIMPEVIAQINVGDSEKIRVVHQAGDKHVTTTREQYQIFAAAAEVTSFITSIAKVYAWADIVICRSGAMTISELAAVGRGSILIPFPYASDDHQTINARRLSDKGAAILIPQEELTVERLVETLIKILQAPDSLLAMAEKAHDMAKMDAVDIVAKECMRYGRVYR